MKNLILICMIMNVAVAAPTAKNKILPVTKTEKPAKATGSKAQALLKDKEDCDDKAKKAKEVEIKPETISLGGNTGCTLE